MINCVINPCYCPSSVVASCLTLLELLESFANSMVLVKIRYLRNVLSMKYWNLRCFILISLVRIGFLHHWSSIIVGLWLSLPLLIFNHVILVSSVRIVSLVGLVHLPSSSSELVIFILISLDRISLDRIMSSASIAGLQSSVVIITLWPFPSWLVLLISSLVSFIDLWSLSSLVFSHFHLD